MKCNKCGTQLADDAKVCPKCGEKIKPLGTETKKKNVLAIIGFTLAILGTALDKWTYCVVSVAGLILSIVGLVKSKSCHTGKGLSIAGIVISSISAFAWFGILILALVI